MTKIALISATRKKYGNYPYENMVLEALSGEFDVELINVGVEGGGLLKYLEVPIVLWRLIKLSRRTDLDIVIRGFETSLLLNKPPVKNVFLAHHIDSSHSPAHSKVFHLIFRKFIFRRLRKVVWFVVVSKYWERYLRQKGYSHTSVVYNAFDPKEFEFTNKEISAFKRKYGLVGKPIVYLGNARKQKGVLESFNALEGSDFHFVTSADPSLSEVNLKPPAFNLRLDHRDYLRLLKASSVVVTMSKFNEGWCRTAHEAMLCKTPVVGSGRGGMEELLEGGGQLICKNFKDLREKVKFATIHQEMGKTGYQFAKNFTFERFKKDWVGIINSIIDLK
ncbi:MAG: hypothetical protein A2W09_08520 [Deltaproteobacteria bacterium RBG_16_50_11]|nr:MAG: hypothetical protein A2W09_08520 [Deltaproteobacteria bacterium RBG_16_50_11]